MSEPLTVAETVDMRTRMKAGEYDYLSLATAGRLLDTIESLCRERDEARSDLHSLQTRYGDAHCSFVQLNVAKERAESENARLREALKPFANIADRYYEKGAGDFISPTFSVGTFRDAQQALTGGGK